MTFTDIRFRIANISVLGWLLIVSVLAIIVSSILWFQAVYKSPQNVFEGMIKQNFTNTGYTRNVDSNENGLNAKETAQLQTGGENIVRTKTILKQDNDTVTTDAISTMSAEYVRYTNIDTQRKSANGKQLDFSKAVNVWAKNETGGPSQTFSQMLLGVVPMGNVPAETRKELIKFIDKNTVFAANYNTVKKEKINGRQVYTYQVQLLPQTYVQMLKIYGKGVGLEDQVAQLDPAHYKDAQPTKLTLSVDAVSRHLVALSYPDSTARSERYSGYGIRKDVELPTKTIPAAELQKRLSTQ
jgi:hypothetical protein